jgi:hypothetical protein
VSNKSYEQAQDLKGRKKSSIKLIQIGLKIPASYKKFLQDHVIGKNPKYLTESDYYREAIREKIEIDCQQLSIALEVK